MLTLLMVAWLLAAIVLGWAWSRFMEKMRGMDRG
jgi:hypothetical protein